LSRQAAHDVLFHGSQVGAYDHHEFPGVVPRTFAAAVALGAVSWPAAAVLHALQVPKLGTLLLVRAVLGCSVCASFSRLRRALAAELGGDVGVWFCLLTALQFHLPFYASRTLQNTFALLCTNLGCAAWLARRSRAAVYWLAGATAVLRCDALLLLAPVGLHLLLSRQLTLAQALGHGLAAVALAVAATAPLDSLLWRRPLWPVGTLAQPPLRPSHSPTQELEVLRFNLLDGRSSEWGTQPAHWYLSSALPRALLGGAPLVPLGALLERRLRPACAAALLYVALYSLLAHKELRFLFPILPLANAAAAAALAALHRGRRKSLLRALLFLCALGLCAATLAGKAVMTAAAAWNYPGGWALLQLHSRHGAACAAAATPCLVHVDVLPAMTGVSRFGEAAGFRYDKTEGLPLAALARFDFLLSARTAVPGFALEHAEPSYAGLSLRQLRMLTQPSVYVHRRGV